MQALVVQLQFHFREDIVQCGRRASPSRQQKFSMLAPHILRQPSLGGVE